MDIMNACWKYDTFAANTVLLSYYRTCHVQIWLEILILEMPCTSDESIFLITWYLIWTLVIQDVLMTYNSIQRSIFITRFKESGDIFTFSVQCQIILWFTTATRTTKGNTTNRAHTSVCPGLIQKLYHIKYTAAKYFKIATGRSSLQRWPRGQWIWDVGYRLCGLKCLIWNKT